MPRFYFVYILASETNGTLYIGITNDLIRRTYEHKHHVYPSFTNEHNVNKFVYYETQEEIEEAIRREKHLKKWRRRWKLELIEEKNFYWNDLSDSL